MKPPSELLRKARWFRLLRRSSSSQPTLCDSFTQEYERPPWLHSEVESRQSHLIENNHPVSFRYTPRGAAMKAAPAVARLVVGWFGRVAKKDWCRGENSYELRIANPLTEVVAPPASCTIGIVCWCSGAHMIAAYGRSGVHAISEKRQAAFGRRRISSSGRKIDRRSQEPPTI